MKLTVPQIVRDVEQYYGMGPGELITPGRMTLTKRNARKIAMNLVRMYTKASWFELSDAFNTSGLRQKNLDIVRANLTIELEYFKHKYAMNKGAVWYNWQPYDVNFRIVGV